MVTEIVEPPNDQLSRRTVLWDVLNAAVMALGLSGVLLGAGTTAWSTLYLPMVGGRALAHGVMFLGQPIDTAWGFTAALTAFGMVACAGLPSGRDEARALIGAFGQGLGGLLVAGGSLLVPLLAKAAGPASGDCCFHESRWPPGEPAAALAFPSVLAGLLMVVAALLVRRLHWGVRAVVPALVWLAALAVRHAVWSP